jgi:hypothetical protein
MRAPKKANSYQFLSVQEPVLLYELYRMKGLNRRAARFRSENGRYSGYDLGELCNRVDAKYPTNGVESSK